MSHQYFQSEKIRTVFIMIGSKSMAEGMTGKSVFPAKMLFVRPDKVRDALMVDRFG